MTEITSVTDALKALRAIETFLLDQAKSPSSGSTVTTMIKAAFDAEPDLNLIIFTTWIPSFNDGEPCVFTMAVNGVWFDGDDDIPEEGGDEDEEGGWFLSNGVLRRLREGPDYQADWHQAGMTYNQMLDTLVEDAREISPALKEFLNTFEDFGHDHNYVVTPMGRLVESEFGVDVKVWARRDGIVVEDYEGD